MLVQAYPSVSNLEELQTTVHDIVDLLQKVDPATVYIDPVSLKVVERKLSDGSSVFDVQIGRQA